MSATLIFNHASPECSKRQKRQAAGQLLSMKTRFDSHSPTAVQKAHSYICNSDLVGDIIPYDSKKCQQPDENGKILLTSFVFLLIVESRETEKEVLSFFLREKS